MVSKSLKQIATIVNQKINGFNVIKYLKDESVKLDNVIKNFKPDNENSLIDVLDRLKEGRQLCDIVEKTRSEAVSTFKKERINLKKDQRQKFAKINIEIKKEINNFNRVKKLADNICDKI